MPQFLRIVLLLFLCSEAAHATWEFAITTKSKIILYDEHWNVVGTAAHQFEHLTAIALDETDEIIYFHDRQHNDSSIFSVKIPTDRDEPHITDTIVQRTNDESVAGIAYDPIDRQIFWTDKQNNKIFYQTVDEVESSVLSAPRVLIAFNETDGVRPDGLAIDVCRRRLYYTNSNYKSATVERINLDGSERTVIVNTDLYMPHGIVIDQLTDRIYWVVDQQGIFYTVESATLDGGDRQIIVRGSYNVPHSLTVTKDAIFWTDVSNNNAIWSHVKGVGRRANATANGDDDTMSDNAEPHEVLKLMSQPNGIVGRSHFLTTLQNDQHCAAVVRKLRNRLLAPKTTRNPIDVRVEKLMRTYCLNGGKYSEQSGICVCTIGYRGDRCETSECHNYCVHGSCSMSAMGFPKCSCQTGFTGARCQSLKCKGHCLNDGVCKLSAADEPVCECTGYYGGERCEKNSTEICALFCKIRKYDPEVIAPFGCYDICASLVERTENGAEIYALPNYEHLEECKTGLSNTAIIVVVAGVVLSLCLVLLLVNGVRRFYKPARPRIKKTFVVRKHASAAPDTPLTNRPMATEQCEITIENCCNMNICDTPCFDPKLVQQTFGANIKETKEDKKILIHNMEDELY